MTLVVMNTEAPNNVASACSEAPVAMWLDLYYGDGGLLSERPPIIKKAVGRLQISSRLSREMEFGWRAKKKLKDSLPDNHRNARNAAVDGQLHCGHEEAIRSASDLPQKNVPQNPRN